LRIAIGNDHTALELKKVIVDYLGAKGYEIMDLGTNSAERYDYPIAGEAVARALVSGEAEKGVLICGTGVGISLAANKVKGIRACVCSDPYTARLSKQHNNTNILAFGSRVVGPDLAKMILDEWLNADFEGGRHQRRLDMISGIEEGRGV
jgi:ribose 5-phosphate isomerase B